jgi:hypothetical protein
MIASCPDRSLPKACGSWADVNGAYRLLSNPAVEAAAIQRPHRELTLRSCADRRIVLGIHDDSDLNFSTRAKVAGLGMIGDGGGRGIMQHTALAATESGDLLGVLDQFFFNRVEAPDHETRRECQARWCESDVWADGVRNIAGLRADQGGVTGARLIHVADRGGDVWSMIRACQGHGDGFVIRAKHDRMTDTGQRLWEELGAMDWAGSRVVTVTAQRSGRNKRVEREARVCIRFGRVRLVPPVNDPRCKDDGPREAWAVYASEVDPPAGEGIEPVEWMLLTSEPVESLADAVRVIGWYKRRWLIEEFHRVLKEGCRVERSQLDHAEDLKRLASVLSVVAVRLIQLRDLAEAAVAPANSTGLAPAESSAMLQVSVPWPWIAVVAHLTRIDAATLTPRQFWHAIARRGGWLARKHDGRPGWKTIWQGWHDIQLFVQAAQWRLDLTP